MRAQQGSIIASSIGILLIVISMVLSTGFIKTRASWSNEQANEFIEASLMYHKGSFDKNKSEEEIQELADTFEERRAALDQAIESNSAIPKYVRYSGYGFLAVGIILYVVTKVKDPDG